jgi:mono/diheme cytochrome c family protein
MDKLINNFRWREGIWGVVAVTGLAAAAVLFVSGRGKAQRNGTADAPVTESRDNSAANTGGSFVQGTGKLQVHVASQANPLAGERRYLQACSACHGAGGMGQPHMGANLRDSRFIREQTDDALVAFVKKGRTLGDPSSVLGLSMPPMGGNSTLEDGQIRDIVAFLRTLQARASAQGTEAELN